MHPFRRDARAASFDRGRSDDRRGSSPVFLFNARSAYGQSRRPRQAVSSVAADSGTTQFPHVQHPANMTLLIIGQSPVASLVLPPVVRALNLNLICAVDVLAAMHVLARTPVSFVVVDEHMPRIDAACFLALKQHDPRFAEIPIHVLRASGEALSIAQLFGLAARLIEEIGATGAPAVDRLPALLARVDHEAGANLTPCTDRA